MRRRGRSRSPDRRGGGRAAERRERSPEQPSSTVLVRNLPTFSTEPDLFALLGEWGPLKQV